MVECFQNFCFLEEFFPASPHIFEGLNCNLHLATPGAFVDISKIATTNFDVKFNIITEYLPFVGRNFPDGWPWPLADICQAVVENELLITLV